MTHPVAIAFHGYILAEREQNLRDDSYFHVTVWNPETSQPEEIQYAATAYPSSPMHPNTVQAAIAATLPSVHAAHAKWNTDMDRVCRARSLYYRMFDVEHYWKPFTGDTVRVARGRKVPKGLVGTVLSSHEITYGYNNVRTYLWLDCGAEGVHKVDMANVDSVKRAPAVLQELFDLSN